jgi:hypothetical protein
METMHCPVCGGLAVAARDVGLAVSMLDYDEDGTSYEGGSDDAEFWTLDVGGLGHLVRCEGHHHWWTEAPTSDYQMPDYDTLVTELYRRTRAFAAVAALRVHETYSVGRAGWERADADLRRAIDVGFTGTYGSDPATAVKVVRGAHGFAPDGTVRSMEEARTLWCRAGSDPGVSRG